MRTMDAAGLAGTPRGKGRIETLLRCDNGCGAKPGDGRRGKAGGPPARPLDVDATTTHPSLTSLPAWHRHGAGEVSLPGRSNVPGLRPAGACSRGGSTT